MTLSEFLSRLEGVRGSGIQYSAKCPAHEDTHASLSISEKDGKILLKCHAGCDTSDIVNAIGLKVSDLFIEPLQASGQAYKSNAIVTAEYTYYDLQGRAVAVKVRLSNKKFYWELPDGSKGRNGAHPLYNWYAVNKCNSLFIVEGEKDVETLAAHKLPAVSFPDGAKSKWYDEYGDFFKDRNVIIIPDNDKPGAELAQMIAGKLNGQAKSIRVLDLSRIWEDIPEKADVSDYLKNGGSIEEIKELTNNTEVWNAEKAISTACLNVISAPDLQKADLPPIRFLVNDILPEGTSLISAPSKIGKSWLVLDMGLAIASGTPFMKHKTNKSGVLYLALEDSLTRLQGRMNKVLGGAEAPENFYFTTKSPTLDDGLIEVLENHLKAFPETKLIIVDTLQKIRGQAHGRESVYAQDYREMVVLKDFADKHQISTFFVHHTRKMKDEDDPFNMISGTNGLMGAADTLFVMVKDKREDKNAILNITGRDVQQVNDLVTFNKDVWKWERIGDFNLIKEEIALSEFNQNPIVRTIQYAVESSKNGWWSGKASELLELGEFVTGEQIAENPQKIGYELKKLNDDLYKRGNIKMGISKNGSGGKMYSFHLENQVDFKINV